MAKQKIIITAETTVDLPKELLDKYNIKTVPFTVLLGNDARLDGEITSKDIFDYVDKENILPRTCAVNEYTFDQFFGDLLKEYDAVIHISLSSKISSAYQNACNAAHNHKGVYVIDSLTLSTGIALLAIKGSELVQKGLNADDIYQELLNTVEKVQASFVVATLEYLHKGGRCSAFSRISSAVLRVKPSIIMQGGCLIADKKFIGRIRYVIEDYCAYIIEKFPNADLTRAFVTFTCATPEMIETAKNALTRKGFKEIYCTTAGATITSHCGPYTLGILYLLK